MSAASEASARREGAGGPELVAGPAAVPVRRRALLLSDDVIAAHLAGWVVLGFSSSVLWALTAAGGHYWPRWIWFAGLVLVTLQLVVRRADDRAHELADSPVTAGSTFEVFLAYKIPLSLWSAALIGLIWAMTGFGSLWPRWAWFGIFFIVGAELVARGLVRRHRRSEREGELAERVGELQRTRRGALEVQAAELRRVERDLHDGAQSRLVALSMQLGRAEEKLADRPQVAALIREARAEASGAIAELRDLARGIAPPVLADRGLEAAARSLADRAAGPVELRANLPERPVAVVETAAYFVIAEALTNAAKHAPGAAVRIELDLGDERLLVRVADDGPGGADPAGGGLTGLRGRVEALDGGLSVSSPVGGGTILAAVLPCAQ